MNKCPGQFKIARSTADLENKKCPDCGSDVEIWPDEKGRKCSKCKGWVPRDKEAVPSCADWCPGGEDMVRQCLGEERYKEWKESKKHDKENKEDTMEECCHHNCIEELRSDHDKILAELDKLEANPEGHAKEFLEFTENFAEPHHQKEEQVLYPAMEEKGVPKEGGPIGVMLMEHELKREHVKELKKAVENNEKDKIKEHALAIVSILRDHINKENNILYPMAEQVLTEEELAHIGHKCEELKKKK